MSTSVDRFPATAPADSTRTRYAAAVDVPGLMVSRITDLYAEEERRRRNVRTERMIRKAQSLK